MQIRCKKEKFNVTECRSFISQSFGLMFRYLSNDGLLFILKKPRKFDLHMIFVFYAISIIFLDSNKKVIKITKVKPFTLFIKGIKSKYILELKNEKNISVGDKVIF